MDREISLKKFLFVIGSLAFIEILIFCFILPIRNYNELKGHCVEEVATCNEDNTICYNYKLDNNATIVTWRGNCSKFYK